MERGYSWLNVRAVDEEKRVIEGIATTPEQARDGDIVETAGIEFRLPLPFLWRHREPFGNVISADVRTDGIHVGIQVGPPGVSQAIDEQWRMVKTGVVRGLSIGFRILEHTYDKTIDGLRILRSEWLELSAVPVPADPNATITSIRSADESILAALGDSRDHSAVRNRTKLSRVADANDKRRGHKMKSFKKKIEELEQRRAPVQESITAIMDKAEEEARDMTADEQRDYDTAGSELRQIDAELDRCRTYEQAVGGAKPVVPELRTSPLPNRPVVEKVESQLPKGIGMARATIALVRAGGSRMQAAELAREYYKDTPGVSLYLRAAIEAGDTTTSGWASQLVPAAAQMQSEFIELLRPATLIGRIPNLRRVPFNVQVPLQTGGGTYGWVGEGQAKPVTKGTLSSATLRWAKCAGIIVITDELAKFSSPSAEMIIRDEMIAGTAQFLDGQFVDSAVAEVANVSPASITNGKNAVSNSSPQVFRTDLNTMLAAFAASDQNPSTAVLLMSQTTAITLSLQVNANGVYEFPDLKGPNPSVAGIPVVISETVADRVILLNARDILFADDGGVRIDISNQAAVEMSSTPGQPDDSPFVAPVMRSLWQNNLVGLRVERYITWKRARTSAVEWVDNVSY